MHDDAVLTFSTKPFVDLTSDDLYDALALRQRVFVVEQRCIYNDCDGADRHALHLLGRDDVDRTLIAYARLFGPGVKFAEAAIGRVVTNPDARRTGAGKSLMREAIARTHTLFGASPIRIGAQRYLEKFYGDLGFVVAGEPYVEDDIPHVEMLLRAP